MCSYVCAQMWLLKVRFWIPLVKMWYWSYILDVYYVKITKWEGVFKIVSEIKCVQPFSGAGT